MLFCWVSSFSPFRCFRRVCIRRDGIRTFDSIRPIKLLFIGEAPGGTEDATGIPFTGRSGRVLNQIFEFTTTAFEFCITNTVCCLPKDVETIMPQLDSEESLDSLVPIYSYSNFDRQPHPEEIRACQPHINEIDKTFKPQGIVYLGQIARNNYMTNKRTLHLVRPSHIARQEYKVLLMKIEARKLYSFILSIRNNT